MVPVTVIWLIMVHATVTWFTAVHVTLTWFVMAPATVIWFKGPRYSNLVREREREGGGRIKKKYAHCCYLYIIYKKEYAHCCYLYIIYKKKYAHCCYLYIIYNLQTPYPSLLQTGCKTPNYLLPLAVRRICARLLFCVQGGGGLNGKYNYVGGVRSRCDSSH